MIAVKRQRHQAICKRHAVRSQDGAGRMVDWRLRTHKTRVTERWHILDLKNNIVSVKALHWLGKDIRVRHIARQFNHLRTWPGGRVEDGDGGGKLPDNLSDSPGQRILGNGEGLRVAWGLATFQGGIENHD